MVYNYLGCRGERNKVPKASADSIRSFLMEFKKIASQKGIYVVDRDKNTAALAELGLTESNRINEILSLSVADYCGGPEKDQDRVGEVWIFGKQIDEREVYMKLKVATIKGSKSAEKKIAKCISFHAAEHPLRFPHRGNAK